ncbi:MAG: MFS transporter [Proteobacteria bacterium]|nr:MFS transporter [Pseudomonadota bacterium]
MFRRGFAKFRNSFATPAFKASLPTIATSTVNKIGDLGLKFFPMLLVDYSFSNEESSLILGFSKVAIAIGILWGGFSGDKFGFRNVILTSFAISAIGLASIPYMSSFASILLAAMLAGFGQGLFRPTVRLLLTQTVPQPMWRESFAWLRTAFNGAVLISNFITFIFSQVGLKVIFLFDAATSILAFLFGLKFLPSQSLAPNSTDVENPLTERPFALLTNKKVLSFIAILLSYDFMTDLFFSVSAAQSRIVFKDRGIAVFSMIFMINTFLCMGLTVWLTKKIHSFRASLTTGIILTFLSTIVLGMGKDFMWAYIVAVLLQTIGELFFTAFSQTLLFDLLPQKSHQGAIYSLILLIQFTAKAIGSSATFYFIDSNFIWIVGMGIYSLFCIWLIKNLQVGNELQKN